MFVLFPDFLKDFNSAHAWHFDVKGDEIRMNRGEFLEGLFPILCQLHRKPLLFQFFFVEEPDILFIVDNHDLLHWSISTSDLSRLRQPIPFLPVLLSNGEGNNKSYYLSVPVIHVDLTSMGGDHFMHRGQSQPQARLFR